MKNDNKFYRFMPLIMAVCVVVGILIGTFYANHFSGNRLSIINTGSNKLNNLLHIIDDQYVDTVKMADLVEKAMPSILAELDPHSVYISAQKVASTNEELSGSFSGIGVEFTIRHDTVHIQNVIAGGPSERAGVVAGEMIVSVDDVPFVGKEVTNEACMRKLKGERGTKVKLGLVKYGLPEKVRYVTVTRDNISTPSISTVYMLNNETGYMRIKNFGETTYGEMLIALAELSQQGFSRLVIDLRDNRGGYMQPAVQMVNEFLPKNRLIVYTEGRKSPRKDYRSDGKGSYQQLPLVVLIDEISASASEIFAGAIQDNDRGTIIGRRSYGKGLVQQPIEFPDGSMIRLTISRYYSPSGRCIQKPYTSGMDMDYEADLITRYESGEYFNEDSIKHDGPEYHTIGGRTVYGGGGITPDIFIAEDTLDMTSYFKEASMSGLIIQFAYDYVDANRATLSKYENSAQLQKYLERQNMVEKFAQYGEKNGLRRRNLMIKKSYALFKRYIHSRIIYNVFNEQALYEYLNKEDKNVQAALKELDKK